MSGPLVLVLSGSAISTLESLAAGGAPLFGRLAMHLRIEPLSAFDAQAFAPRWKARARASAFGILGGTPAYWAAIDPALDLRRNVASLLLDPEGKLRLQLENIVAQEEGLGDASAYNGIIRAVAGGATARARIADATGLKQDQALVRRLDTLVGLGYLDRVPLIEAPRNAPVRYRITDPALRFFHAFVTPNSSLLERTSALEAYDQVVEPHLDTYLGHAFERLVAPTYDRLHQTRSLPPVHTWSRWEGLDRDRRPLEIDIVAPIVNGGVMTGAVKWNRRPLGIGVFQQHLDAVRRAAEAGQRWAHSAYGAPLLFLAAGGFDERFLGAARDHTAPVLTWTVEDVYAET